MKAKVVELRQKRLDRKAAKVARKTGATPELVVAEQAVGDDEAPLEVAVESDQKITMTPEQYDQLAFMATDQFRAWVVDALAKAHAEEGAMPILDQLQEVKELPASQQAERVHEILSTDPAILEGLERQVAEHKRDDPA